MGSHSLGQAVHWARGWVSTGQPSGYSRLGSLQALSHLRGQQEKRIDSEIRAGWAPVQVLLSWLCGLDKVLHLSEPLSIPYRIGMIKAPNPAGGEEDFKRQKYKTAP